jgi:hypothetical protein
VRHQPGKTYTKKENLPEPEPQHVPFLLRTVVSLSPSLHLLEG